MLSVGRIWFRHGSSSSEGSRAGAVQNRGEEGGGRGEIPGKQGVGIDLDALQVYPDCDSAGASSVR